MSLTSGTKLSSYEILEPTGAGGMGEVYKARDTKLGREVAIKVLPEAFAQNEERLARFEREARLLASLNHPNIATLYGFEQSNGVQFLVMELADGETLAGRLRRGPIPVEDALPIFKQIAEALEAAHEKGIIHRDLKPANIKVASEGKVKVLDFGLAKAMSGDSVKGEVSESPTITRDATATGVILGTAAYMSPEQARGKQVDKRTDIWGFSCVLYESLTGKVAFLGETVTDTMVKILEKEPDWGRLAGNDSCQGKGCATALSQEGLAAPAAGRGRCTDRDGRGADGALLHAERRNRGARNVAAVADDSLDSGCPRRYGGRYLELDAG